MRRKQFLYVIITYFINDVKIKLLFTQLIYIFTICFPKIFLTQEENIHQ